MNLLIVITGHDGVTTVAVKTLKENATEVDRKDLLSELEVSKFQLFFYYFQLKVLRNISASILAKASKRWQSCELY